MGYRFNGVCLDFAWCNFELEIIIKEITMQNPYGLIPRDPLPGQAVYNRIFSGGGQVGASKDWRDLLPPRERQYNIPFCVSFSRTNCAEAKGREAGIDVNLSDRELGVISGTTKQGNYLDVVADTLRKVGVTTEVDVPFTQEMLNNISDSAWNKTFALPSTLGKKRYKGGDFSFVIGRAQIVDALNYSPLQLAIGIGDTWESAGIVNKPNSIGAYHAVTLYHVDAQGYMYIQDSIGKELKTLTPDYPYTGILSFRDLPENWKDIMAEIEFVHRVGTSEYAFLEQTPHTEVLHKAVNEKHLEVLSEVFGVNIKNPAGQIDFNKARDINI